MHEGRIVHFEDDDDWQGVVRRQLEGSSHQFVGGAATLPYALRMLEQMKKGEVDANIVVLDGNLSESVSHNDARAIRERIRKLGLPVRVIGFSSNDLTREGIEVDATVIKTTYKYGSMVQVIDELPEPEIAE